MNLLATCRQRKQGLHVKKKSRNSFFVHITSPMCTAPKGIQTSINRFIVHLFRPEKGGLPCLCYSQSLADRMQKVLLPSLPPSHLSKLHIHLDHSTNVIGKHHSTWDSNLHRLAWQRAELKWMLFTSTALPI